MSFSDTEPIVSAAELAEIVLVQQHRCHRRPEETMMKHHAKQKADPVGQSFLELQVR